MNTISHMKISSLCLGVTAMMLAASTARAQSPALTQAIKITDNELFDKASSAFKVLLAKDASNAETYFYFGENLLAADNTDSAEILYKKGIELNSKMPLNHIGLAKVYRTKGKMSEAQASMDAAFALFTEKGVKVKDEMKVRTHVEASEALLIGAPKDAARAIDHAKKAIAIDETNAAAYIVKGDALFESNQLNASEPLQEYRKAAELDPASPKPMSRIGYMYYRGRLYDKAIQYYTDAIKADANFAPAYRDRSDAYYYSNKIEEATKDNTKYLELNKDNVKARIRNAFFLYLLKKYDEALTELNEAEKVLGQNDPIINRVRGYILYEKADYANALKAMQIFMDKYAKDKISTTDYEYMGRIYMKLGTDDKLMGDYFYKAIFPDFKAKSALADEIVNYYKSKKDTKNVTLWYYNKVKWGSKDANDWYYTGINALDAKMYGLADTAFTEYVKVMPDFAAGWLYLARAKDGMDTLQPKKWTALEAYGMYTKKLKPEETDKNNGKISEAYYYFARYYYLSDKKDLAIAKCWSTKVQTLAASEFWTKTADAFLKQADIAKATAATDCTQ